MRKSVVFEMLMVGLTGLSAAGLLAAGLSVAAPLHAHEAGDEAGQAGQAGHEAGHEGGKPAPAMPSQSTDEMHQHGSVEVPAGHPLPTVGLVIHPDARKGWNVEMQVSNFQLAPERVNQPDQSSGDVLEGHAHLYVDGVKLTRLYGSWYYLESLPPGTHQISVGLTTNSHATLMHNGQPIQATVTLDVPAHTPAQ